MPHPIALTFLQQLALSQQGLGAQSAFGSGLDGTLRAIEHLGYVQIDTLSVIERAHHHVLWSRVPGYAPEHLNQLCTQGQIFEYWFHAAATSRTATKAHGGIKARAAARWTSSSCKAMS